MTAQGGCQRDHEHGEDTLCRLHWQLRRRHAICADRMSFCFQRNALSLP
jgi:hypothetical protein